jgi:signal peptidase I
VVNKTKVAQVKDIVIIKDEKPNSNILLIKRVIANTEGDHIEFMQGKVVLNGEVLDEPYAIGNTYDYNNMGTIVLGKNEVFYLGDNRENSYDSRQYGGCTNEQILGVVENWSISINNFFRAFR